MNEGGEVAARRDGGVYRDHSRTFADHRHVYAVVSRRSGGVSVGINLSPARRCNFACVYCQVDRSELPSDGPIEVARLVDELEDVLDEVSSGRLFEWERFRDTPPALRCLRDIAFSGDGEPTACPQFPQAVQATVEVRRRRGPEALPLVLITNASRLHHPAVCQALAVLDANHGEIWAKLDAGTAAYYRRVNRTAVPWRRTLDNITAAAQARPLVIQSLFMALDGKAPPATELESFCRRLNAITHAGGRIRRVQICTVARRPAEPWVGPLADDQVEGIAELVRRRTGLRADAFGC